MGDLIRKIRSNELVYGSLINFSIKLLSFFLTYLMMYLIINNYGIEFYGKYNLYLTFIGIVSILIVFGTDVIFLKEISVLNTKIEKVEIFKKVSVVIFVNSLIICSSLLFINLIPGMKLYFDKNTINIYLILFLSILMGLTSIFVSGLRGTDKILLYSLSERFLIRLFMSITLLMSIVLFLNIETIMLVAYIINTIVILFIFKKYVFLEVPIYKNEVVQVYRLKERKSVFGIYIQAKHIFSSSLLLLLISRTDTFFLSVYSDLESVGVYNAILQVSLLINFAMSSINGILSPMISRGYENKDIVTLEKTLRHANKIIMGSSLITGLLLLIMIKPLFLLLSIKTDLMLLTIFIILIVGQIISGSMGSVVNLLNMSGHFKQVSIATLLSFFINIVFCLILIPAFGLVGAAISTSIGIISRDLISTLYGFKIFKFKFSNYDFRKIR